MDTDIMVKIEVQCECGNYLDVKDATSYKQGELSIEVDKCEDCISLAQTEIT